MTLRFYFDHHMPRAIYRGLRRRGIDVLTTQDDGTERWQDEELFARAAELGRVMVSQDPDHIAIARRWMAAGRPFVGLIKVNDPQRQIGRVIDDLQLIAEGYSAEEMANSILIRPALSTHGSKSASRSIAAGSAARRTTPPRWSVSL
jgi:predicted nuclease of predicted toxin-antitoxin system